MLILRASAQRRPRPAHAGARNSGRRNRSQARECFAVIDIIAFIFEFDSRGFYKLLMLVYILIRLIYYILRY